MNKLKYFSTLLPISLLIVLYTTFNNITPIYSKLAVLFTLLVLVILFVLSTSEFIKQEIAIKKLFKEAL